MPRPCEPHNLSNETSWETWQAKELADVLNDIVEIRESPISFPLCSPPFRSVSTENIPLVKQPANEGMVSMQVAEKRIRHTWLICKWVILSIHSTVTEYLPRLFYVWGMCP